jgi:hypothetical protein
MQYPTIAQPQYAFAPTMMAEGGLVPAARAVQSKGRGDDSMLVHMTPREVGGLQALAMQHGGSLSINPQTGLPEAGFLKNILPTLLGVGLSFIPGVGPMAAGLTVGGIQTVRTGDLGQGLLAGLGAYGGASLAGGLQAAGASAATPTAGLEFANAASPEFLASQGAGASSAGLEAFTNPNFIAETGAGAANIAGAPATATFMPPKDVFGNVLGVDEMASLTGDSSRVLAGSGQVAPTFASNAAQAGRGVGNLFTQEGAFKEFIGTPATKTAEATGLGGGFGAAKTVGMAAAPALLAPPEPYEMPAEEEFNYEGPYTPSTRRISYPDDNLRRRTSEFTYFTPSNPVPFAEGGETSTSATSGPDVAVSPAEARVYQDILNVQRLAGLPAIDPNRFAVMPGRSYEQFVYNPIEGGPVPPEARREVNYEFAPLMSREEAEALKRKPTNPFLRLFGKGSRYATGGRVSVPQLEDGGFVLTKKAVDGLGKGSNKKGQQVASAGLGAIPIKGAGAKRGPKAGVDDKIKTSIEGKRPALVSNGEAYVPKDKVKRGGGAKKFYALMKKAERAAA